MDAKANRLDAVVVGAGPAGMALTVALRRAGLDVRCISARPDAPWVPVFGIWAEDAERAGIVEHLSHRWERGVFVGEDGRRIELPRAYARIDNRSLQRHLVREAGAGTFVPAVLDEVVEREGYAEALTTDGRAFRAALVFDATGHAGSLAGRKLAEDAVAQTAWGFETRAEGVPFDEDTFVFMDYRGASTDDADTPTFLYAMPLGEGRWFFEETVLAGRPGLDFATLRARLFARLEGLGVVWDGVEDEEVCWIPMAGGSPPRRGRVVAWGAAAGLVHPATGYQVGHMLRWAPEVARAVRAALDAGLDGEALADAAQEAVWPAARRRAWALYELGAQGLIALDRSAISRFFAAFLSQPEADWSAYLSASATGADVSAIMARFFRRAPMPLRRTLASFLFLPGGPTRLRRALTGRS